MNDSSLEREVSDARLRRELDAAARRERARILQRFLSQSAVALLGRGRAEAREPLCAACS